MKKSQDNSFSRSAHEPGLYFVATPIGAARDITLRSLDLLQEAEVLAAEDTRNTRRLLDIHGIALNGRPLIAYHDHNGAAQRPKLLSFLEEGKSVAYVSDAGTPMVADPGFSLGQAAIEAGHKVFSAPGASALLAALTVSGLPTDRFFFEGFLPNKSGARQKTIQGMANIPGTLVFYENAKRIEGTLTDLLNILGDRQAVLCRELTKKFEETIREPLSMLLETVQKHSNLKGECVLLIGPAKEQELNDDDIISALRVALADNSLKAAVAIVAENLDLPRKRVYSLALTLRDQV